MNQSDKSKIRTSKGLILVIFILIAVALAFKMYNPQTENEVDFFSEDAKKQISVELRNDQTQVSQTAKITGAEAAESLADLKKRVEAAGWKLSMERGDAAEEPLQEN